MFPWEVEEKSFLLFVTLTVNKTVGKFLFYFLPRYFISTFTLNGRTFLQKRFTIANFSGFKIFRDRRQVMISNLESIEDLVPAALAENLEKDDLILKIDSNYTKVRLFQLAIMNMFKTRKNFIILKKYI